MAPCSGPRTGLVGLPALHCNPLARVCADEWCLDSHHEVRRTTYSGRLPSCDDMEPHASPAN